jgi:hypothetical protein
LSFALGPRAAHFARKSPTSQRKEAPHPLLKLSVLPGKPNRADIMVQINEVKGTDRANRTAVHTHIKGLGLNANGTAEKQAAGFVGQVTAREVG